MNVLILGGTTEASALARALAGRRNVAPVLSLAGRTLAPAPPPIPHRVGGFGGAGGLAEHLARARVDAVIDATHPFAARISAHAVAACAAAGVPLLAFTRPPWRPRPGDRWTAAPDLAAAALALGPARTTALLTVGRLGLAAFRAAPHHRYVIRTIDPPDPADLPPDRALILARGPFALDDEAALMRREGIEAVVTKNSGGGAAAAKLEAARTLGLRVIAVERPRIAGARHEVEALDAVLAWIETHRPAPRPRGAPGPRGAPELRAAP